MIWFEQVSNTQSCFFLYLFVWSKNIDSFKGMEVPKSMKIERLETKNDNFYNVLLLLRILNFMEKKLIFFCYTGRVLNKFKCFQGW